ncbi:gamma-glutamylcyclotransferase family protein [Silvimonas iriomotensis]|uniref:Gamma-glutamylcyclotransferase family protein n=1 Tax=Silvimonas iriomotensis TaxID=449662 RepID=A0ABQ2P6G6_9NEIS|nr:gamma-glutamylcyclotransferase family protein [Silvimonas iriomotensis]GGP19179.1 gamma-glutamylcyclotransferase [Silvimonas iriomotensis]
MTHNSTAADDGYVFVYGTLKQGCRNHHWMRGTPCLGAARTVASYALYLEQRIPFLFKGESRYPVTGELYRVDADQLAHLDVLERHPEWYARERIAVHAPDGSQVQAWAYFCPAPIGTLLPEGVYLEQLD